MCVCVCVCVCINMLVPARICIIAPKYGQPVTKEFIASQ